MARKGVEEVLIEQIRTSSCFASLDEFYKEFQIWQLAIRSDVKKLLSSKGKYNEFTVPTTPGASLRKRPRLSVIRESPADNIGKLATKPLPKHLKNGNAKNQYTRKLRRSNRIKLTFDVSDEEINSADDAESHDTVDSSNQDSLNTNVKISQLPKSNPSFECRTKGNLDEIHNKEESTEKTTKSKKSNDYKRNAQRDVTDQNVEFEMLEIQDQLPVDASPTVAPTLLLEPMKESDNVAAVQKDSIRRRKGRSKNHSIIGRNKRNTASKRSTRSNARTTENLERETLESQDKHSGEVSPIVLLKPISKSTMESIDRVSVEKRQSILEGKEKLKNQSIVDNEKLFTASQRSSVVASVNGDNQTSDRHEDIIPEISNIAVSVNNSNSQEQFFKKISVSVIRIDETIENLQHPVKITEEILRKCSGNNISGTSKKSPCKNSDSTGKKSLEKSSMGEKRKRDLSCSDNRRPSKKSSLHENDRENKVTNLVENGVQGRKTRSSLLLSRLQNKGNTLSASPTKSRKSSRFSEVVSFSQLTSPISNKRASKNEVCENSVGNINSEEDEEQEEVKDDDDTNKADSGEGNSTNSEVECSEYYSVGSKVDVDEISKAGRENANACNSATESKLRQSRRKKTEKAAIKPNTPDTRDSRKGAHAALFSPYANEPVKNRVAAYEILSSLAEEMEIPVTVKRVTRTKTRAMVAAAAAAAAAEAAAAAAEAGILEQKNPMDNNSMKSGSSQKLARASLWRAKKRLAAAAKKK